MLKTDPIYDMTLIFTKNSIFTQFLNVKKKLKSFSEAKFNTIPWIAIVKS